MSTNIKLSKAQLSKIVQSEVLQNKKLGNLMSSLDKKHY